MLAQLVDQVYKNDLVKVLMLMAILENTRARLDQALRTARPRARARILRNLRAGSAGSGAK